MSTEASQAKMATGGFKPQDSSQSLLCDVTSVRPPSSSKHTDSIGVVHQGFHHHNSSHNTTQKRQRTNTQLGLQSHKHSSLRQSTNNLTLQDLMAQQTTTGSHKPPGPAIKQSSNRGNTTEKASNSAAASFAAAGSVVSNFKSNSLVKSTIGSKKVGNSNNLLGTGQSRSSGIQ